MTRIQDFIQPVSKGHSIKEAVITVFLSHLIESPQAFEGLLKTKFSGIFTKFEPLNTVQITMLPTGQGNTSTLENTGFRFQKYVEDELRLVFQVTNNDQQKLLSFHSLEYTRWQPFFATYMDCLHAIIGQSAKFQVEAFNLHYTDEFIWTHDSEPDLGRILNKDSDFIAPSLLGNAFPRLDLFFTTDQTDHNGTVRYDRINIAVTPTLQPTITISHTISHQLNVGIDIAELAQQTRFKELLTDAHLHNKEVLQNLLSPETAQLIQLQKSKLPS